MKGWIAALALLTITVPAMGAGISVDTGLTPALDRWIFRSQVRLMGREPMPQMAGDGMQRTMVPVVLAYGLRSNVTLMVRQAFVSQEMNSAESSGLGDTFLMAKLKAYRVNTRSYVFGVSPTLGIELPTGETGFTSDTWDFRPGMYFTLRHGMWAEDLNVAYFWNGLAGEPSPGMDPGDELNIDLALARQFGLNEDYSHTIAPVLELGFDRTAPVELRGNRVGNTGESVLTISPGVKLTMQSFILETLWQYPAWQSQKGSLPEQESMLLLGMRYMF